MRRLITVLFVAAITATGSLWWLHDGDLQDAVKPVLTEWNADLLARDAGLAPEASEAETSSK